MLQNMLMGFEQCCQMCRRIVNSRTNCVNEVKVMLPTVWMELHQCIQMRG